MTPSRPLGLARAQCCDLGLEDGGGFAQPQRESLVRQHTRRVGTSLG